VPEQRLPLSAYEAPVSIVPPKGRPVFASETGEPKQLTFQQLHDIRRNVDQELYGLRGNKDPWSDSYKDALHRFRSAVSGEIERSLDEATSNSSAWKSANRDYQVGAKALEFADKGLDRNVGNNQVSPTELMSALGGMAGLGAATGSPAAGGIGALTAYGATALARRYGSGLQGAGARRLSNALMGVNRVNATPEAETLTTAMARILRQRYPDLDVARAAADPDNGR
jgi:hypothetical protein